MQQNSKNKTTALILLIIGILAIFILKAIPLVNAVIFSFKQYNPAMGMSGSPFVGSHNFEMLTSQMIFPSLILNTLVNNLSALSICIALSVVLSLGMHLVRNKALKVTFASLFLLSYVLAPVVYPALLIKILPSGVLINKQLFPLIYGGLTALRLAPLAVLGSMAFSAGGKSTGRMLIGVLIFLIALCAQPLSSAQDIATLLSNPLNYELSQMVDNYIFRAGFMQMNMGTTAALWILKYLFNLVASLVCIALVMLILKGIKSRPAKTGQTTGGPEVLGIIICTIYAVFVVGSLVFAFISADSVGVAPSRLGIMWGAALVTMLIYALLTSALCLLLAYPLCYSGKAAKIVYALLLAIAVYSGAGSIHQFIMYRSAGIYNTLPGIVLSYSVPFVLVLAYALYFHAQTPDSTSKGYFKLMLPAFITGSVLWFSTMWTTYFNNMIFASTPELRLPALMLREAAMGGAQPGGIIPLGALVMTVLPPVVLIAVGAVVIGAMQKPKKS